MKARISGLIGIVALVGGTAVSCKNDPTADGVGTPVAVELEFSHLDLTVGDSATVIGRIVDNRLTPLEGDITFTSCDPTSATVALDPSYSPVPPLSKRAIIAATGPNATCITASAGSAKPDSTSLTILPKVFGGAASTTALVLGQPVTLTSTSTLKFDSTTTVDFGGGAIGVVTDQTADQLTVIAAWPDNVAPGPITVKNVVITYVPDLHADLPTSTTFDAMTNPYDPNSNPDPAYTLAIPAAGDSLVFYDGFKSTETDNFYSFTLAAQTTLSFAMSWGTTADLDLLMCDAGCNNFEGNFGAATGANPEHTQMTLAAGTHNLWINVYDANGDPAHLYKLVITNP